MKNKIFGLLLSIFVLLPFSVNASAISDDNLAIVSLDNYTIPTWWSVAKNTDKALTIKYVVINPEYSYVVLDICSNGPVKDFYISNASKINSWFDESNIVILLTNETCKTHNGYNGTIKKVQLQVGKFTTNEEFGMMEVTSTLHLVNTFDYAVEYSFTGLSVFKEDYLTQIVNNQEVNNKLDDINETLNGEDNDFNSKKCGIVCKLKGIGSGIIELPGKLVTLLIDGIKGLFVPTDDQLYEIVNDSKDLTENFGFIGESMNFFINIFTTLLGLVNANGCLELPEFTIGSTTLFDSHTFWESRNVCLADNEILSSNIDTIRSFTSIVLVAMFVSFAASKFSSILSKQSSENIYQNDAIDATSKTKWI